MDGPQLVFVYGALMRGLSLHHHMNGGAFAGNASTRGTLVSLGRYPGLIDGAGSVKGEVYTFDDLPSALDVLDDIEEFDATDPAGSLYVREDREITLADGTPGRAWLYVYNGPRDGAAGIQGGDWRAFTDSQSRA